MFKHAINNVLAAIIPLIAATSYWDIIKYIDSLLLFGEPKYPTE